MPGGFSSQRHWFDPRPMNMGSAVDKVALGRGFLPSTLAVSLSILFQQCSVLILSSITNSV